VRYARSMALRITKDEVDKLSRGLSTRNKVGSRNVGHRLTVKERILFEAAKRQGFLKIPAVGLRENVSNIYRKWCEATGIPCDIRVAQLSR
jgi:hypothetical protein